MSFNNRLIHALLREPIDRTPVWMMRQAGRYLPEYRAIRERCGDFFTLCQTPELAMEVTLQPLRRFALDAAIIFSDILTVPQAMGCDISLVENQGPVVAHPIRTERDLQKLTTDVTEKLFYVRDAITLTKSQLSVPLIGFAGSPWTVATYLVEGKSSRTFSTIKSMLLENPALAHQLLEKITQATIQHVNAQITAGANVMMIFDTWGGALPEKDYLQFSLHYMKKISDAMLHMHHGKKIPLIFFSKNCDAYLEKIAASGCDAVGVDWTTNLFDAKKRIRNRVALQGNLNPEILLTTPEKIKMQTREILSVYQDQTGFVFNLGHGIIKETPIAHVEAMLEVVCSRRQK